MEVLQPLPAENNFTYSFFLPHKMDKEKISGGGDEVEKEVLSLKDSFSSL